MENTSKTEVPDNTAEQKTSIEIFAAGGFYSGASFDVMNFQTKLYQSWTKLRKSSPSFEEFTLNNKTLSIFDFNPLSLYKDYVETQKYCEQNATLELFNLRIQEANPRIIMGHSIGCHLIENWLNWLKDNDLGIPKNVQRIIYYQSDSRTVSNPIIENHYSPLDPMLIISTIVNGTIPVGLMPDSSHESNVPMHPSVLRSMRRILPIDLHTDTINNLDHQKI